MKSKDTGLTPDLNKDFEWLRVRHFVKDALHLNSLPNLEGVLFVIGLQELGRWDFEKSFSKEEKQDLMHIGICALLEPHGYFEFLGRDQDGWPHWSKSKPFDVNGVKKQESFIIDCINDYFRGYLEENHPND